MKKKMHWTVISDEMRLDSNKYTKVFLCRCVCGIEKMVRKSHLLEEKSLSCGCKRGYKHGKSKSREYRSWVSMMYRCFNKKSENYKWYGGKSITVCKRWLIFENFYKDMGQRPFGKSLDRKNPMGNYCKNNCRWASDEEQANNRTNNVLFEFKGKKLTIPQISRLIKIPKTTLRRKIDQNIL